MGDENLTRPSTHTGSMPGDDSPVMAKRPFLVGLNRSRSEELMEYDDPMPLLGHKLERDSLDLEDAANPQEKEDDEDGEDRRHTGPWRQASKSTVDESDKLLVDGDVESNSDEEEVDTRSLVGSVLSSMALPARTIEY